MATLLQQLQTPYVTSETGSPATWTGHFERRELIRKSAPKQIVEAHNALVKNLLARGEVTQSERDIFLALSQECTEPGGKFYGTIFESGTTEIGHQDGISRHNPDTGLTQYHRGETRMAIWSIIPNTKPPQPQQSTPTE